MSALVLCAACQFGDHERHDGTWHGTPGLLGGHQCPCPGGCEPQPDVLETLSRLIAIPAEADPSP